MLENIRQKSAMIILPPTSLFYASSFQVKRFNSTYSKAICKNYFLNYEGKKIHDCHVSGKLHSANLFVLKTVRKLASEGFFQNC